MRIIKKVRKFSKIASIVSVGPPKDEEDDKKADRKDVMLCSCQKMCQRCDVIWEDAYCSVL